MTTLLALLVGGSALSASPADAVRWGLAPDATRWYVESDVVLPQHLWFEADFNKQARVRTFQVRMVLDCSGVTPRAKATRLDCHIEDAALGGVTFTRERGKLQPVLEELDDKLTGATLQVVLTERGHVRAIRLKNAFVHDQRNRRINRMNEILRLVTARALAGFDLVMPREGNRSGDSWVQHTDLIFGAPSLSGVRGSVDEVHHAEWLDDGRVAIRTEGRGTSVPGPMSTVENIYLGNVEADAVFDTQRGLLVERAWSMAVSPTPSSPLAQGWQGIPYAQRGRIELLDAGEAVDVGETREWTPSTELPPTTLQRMTPFAWADPGAVPLWGSVVTDMPESLEIPELDRFEW